MGGGNQVPEHFDPVFNVKPVEEQRKDPTLPQRYQSKPSKTGRLAGALLKKFINSMQDRVPDPFEDLFEMPCSIIVSGAESGDKLPHTDVSTTADMLPTLDRHPSSCQISTFVALSPQYRLNIVAGTAMGRPRRRGGTRSSSNRGRSSSWSALPGTTGSPLPPGNRCRGQCLCSGPPIGIIRGLSRIRRIWTPTTPLELKDCLGLLEWGGGEDVPTFGQLLLLGVGLEARVGLANRDVVADVFSPPRGAARPPGHMNHLGGHGQPFRPPHHLLHCQAPRVRGLLQRAGKKGKALVVAQGAVGRVGEGEGPDLGHGDRLLGGHGHRKSESEV